MLTLPETAPRRHRLNIAEFAVETFAPLDDVVTPSMREAPGTSSVCAGQCDNPGGTNQNNCKTCHGCNSDGNCSNVVEPDGK